MPTDELYKQIFTYIGKCLCKLSEASVSSLINGDKDSHSIAY